MLRVSNSELVPSNTKPDKFLKRLVVSKIIPLECVSKLSTNEVAGFVGRNEIASRVGSSIELERKHEPGLGPWPGPGPETEFEL